MAFISAVALVIIGFLIIVDGAGSILIQLKQSFFWWQFERIVRMIGGFLVIIIGITLL